MFEATQPVAGVSLDLLGAALVELLRLQREIQRSLASEFMAARESTGLLRPTLLIAMAFAFGAVHAVTPGHGKSIVVSYFLGQGGVARRGVTMSAKVIVTHVLSAIALATATTFVIDVSLGMRPADFPAVRLISYAGVALVGSWLLWRAVRRKGGTSLHAPATREGALPYFAGMSPCPLTTIILVVALHFLRRHAAHVERIARGLEILGAAAVTVIGLLLLAAEIV
jgi:High-affinity nickel-transport protein